ncbi:hypothetical protein U4I65_02390 [Stenotrophomonas maltophilia]|uniref:hypothetical protein n=1 Tax=Stenotrophomonas maltophilia TaxID=40324 RepID=UPI002ACCC592|nr:hypothetical protein [Stenotrophomonas maltophilia]MDZ5813885.1 hypothetical protein [Stenotrophomonas maltophilia]
MNENTNTQGIESTGSKAHRWNDVGERCLDCGDEDWMNDPVCRPRVADPDISATPTTDPGNLIPVDVLQVLDIEIDAITLQVKRGTAPQHALRDMVAARVAVANAIAALQHFVDDAKCVDLGGGGAVGTTCESLEHAKSALRYVKPLA